MKNRFDLENELMDCWKVTDDINMVTKHFVDSPKWEGMSGELSDAMMNKYFAVAELYELKFQKLFDTFVECIQELEPHAKRPSPLDKAEFDWSTRTTNTSGLNSATPADWDAIRARAGL